VTIAKNATISEFLSVMPSRNLDWRSAAYFIVGVVWQGYVAGMLMFLRDTRVSRTDLSRGGGLCGMVIITCGSRLDTRESMGQPHSALAQIHAMVFWLGLPVTAGSLLLAV